MTLRQLSRTAVGGYLKLLRLPLDAAAGMGRRNGSRRTIALDRLEARARSLAGRTLRDDELVRDGELRRLAADERDRARRLRSEAQRRSEHAEQQLSEREKGAARQRREAARRAATKTKQADRQRQAEVRRVADLEAQHRHANEKATARNADAIEERSKRSRLQQLDKEADALEKKQDALTAKQESQRLRRAATNAKAERKGG